MLLNSKSILNCNEEEEKEHNNEIEEISKMIYSLPNYDCAIIIKYVDKANEKRKEEILSCNMHDYLDMLEYIDIKNGIDLVIEDNNIFSIHAYGQCYKLKDDFHFVETNIYIMPYDENRDFIDISNFLVANKEMQFGFISTLN